MSKYIFYYGKTAAKVLFKTRPQAIKKVYVSDKKEFQEIIDWCKKRKIFYKKINKEKLYKISGSVHHGGIAILGSSIEPLSEKNFFERLSYISGPQCIIFLDNIGNPHNIGFILRTAAHFGVEYVIHESKKTLNPSTYRVSEGAAEFVKIISTNDSILTINSLKEFGFKCVFSSSKEGENLFKTRFPRRVLLFIGNEETGISKKFLDVSDFTVTIPGTRKVESLNVSVATGIIIGEIFRQHSLMNEYRATENSSLL